MLRGICLGLAGLAAAGTLACGCMATPAAATADTNAGQAIECKVNAATARCAYVDEDGDGVCDNREDGTCVGQGCSSGHRADHACGAGVRHGRDGACHRR